MCGLQDPVAGTIVQTVVIVFGVMRGSFDQIMVGIPMGEKKEVAVFVPFFEREVTRNVLDPIMGLRVLYLDKSGFSKEVGVFDAFLHVSGDRLMREMDGASAGLAMDIVIPLIVFEGIPLQPFE